MILYEADDGKISTTTNELTITRTTIQQPMAAAEEDDTFKFVMDEVEGAAHAIVGFSNSSSNNHKFEKDSMVGGGSGILLESASSAAELMLRDHHDHGMSVDDVVDEEMRKFTPEPPMDGILDDDTGKWPIYLI